MKASDVMSTPVITVPPEAPLREVARTLAERRISAVPVVEGERVVGIVSEADVLRRLPGDIGCPASEVMTRDLATVAPDTPLEDVAATLAARGIRRVPVVKEGRLVGIVSRANLVHALAVKPLANVAPADDDADVRVALLERLGSERWWRGGESSREAPVRARPTFGVRRAGDRGHARQGWSETFYTFSFGDFHDPAYIAYGPLQAINEKVVQPHCGSTTYGVRDVEIVTYLLEGVLSHENSLDDKAELPAGAVQCLSAGSGVRFSETNTGAAPARFLEFWLETDRVGLPASYAHTVFPAQAKRGRLQALASGDGRDGSLRLREDAVLYAGLFTGAERARLALGRERLGYVHVARGAAAVQGEELGAGDGLAVAPGTTISLERARDAEVLVLDLPEAAA
jgi:hypothetical protein